LAGIGIPTGIGSVIPVFGIPMIWYRGRYRYHHSKYWYRFCVGVAIPACSTWDTIYVNSSI